MMPGVGHCYRGPGANTIGGLQQPAPTVGGPPTPASFDATHDVMSALQLWVEGGVAPERFIATKYTSDDPAKGIAFQRPICAFPAEAIYAGGSAPPAASTFVCRGNQIHDEWKLEQ